MVCLDGVEMPRNCHECDAFGISDVVGLKCPCIENREEYNFEKRPDGCSLSVILIELTDKERDYIANILYKQDWTETDICRCILKKLGYGW